jgi:hypothetical protein
MRVTTTRLLKSAREETAYQFEQEIVRLAFTVQEKLRNYRYIVTDNRTHKQYTAMVLPTSFDYYEFHLNRGKRRVDLLIVRRHNAVVPIAVLSLSQVQLFEPLAVPDLGREESKRRNHEEANLLLSELLLNFESAWEEVNEQMSDRQRQRYQRRVKEYSRGRIGRPWAS